MLILIKNVDGITLRYFTIMQQNSIHTIAFKIHCVQAGTIYVSNNVVVKYTFVFTKRHINLKIRGKEKNI